MSKVSIKYSKRFYLRNSRKNITTYPVVPLKLRALFWKLPFTGKDFSFIGGMSGISKPGGRLDD